MVGLVEGAGGFGEPILHTLLAEMHEFPQGIPFLQFFCASTVARGKINAAATINLVIEIGIITPRFGGL